VLEHLEAGGDVFELLADLFADLVPLAAAARAGLLFRGQVVLDADARQVLGQLAAPMFMPVA